MHRSEQLNVRDTQCLLGIRNERILCLFRPVFESEFEDSALVTRGANF
jgi:hypothetical protein